MTTIPTTDTPTTGIRLDTADALELRELLHLLIDWISYDDGRLNTCMLEFLAEHDDNPGYDTRHLTVDLIRLAAALTPIHDDDPDRAF
jgi:hypothetical protein